MYRVVNKFAVYAVKGYRRRSIAGCAIALDPAYRNSPRNHARIDPHSMNEELAELDYYRSIEFDLKTTDSQEQLNILVQEGKKR